MPPDVIAFDVMETLCSLASLAPLLAAAGGDATTLDRWFSHLLQDGFAITAARSYAAFRDVAKAALTELLPHAKPAQVDKVLAGLGKLDAHPDSAPAMGRAVLDARVVVISNTSAATTRKLLARGGLDTFVEAVVSADDVQAWKPRADAYSYAAATTDTTSQRLAMVTVHPWDVLGAAKAGLVTGWCNRQGATFPPAFGHPDVTGTTLLDVVEGLFALKGTG
ncbi:MAG TPA: HAD-IA family hydrolase [Acidimicrobiales bacterium]|jgi:2-haloacid dehalogenase|nr:HAD-IA family hydrolase [Acidimicrobiales bacterium]